MSRKKETITKTQTKNIQHPIVIRKLTEDELVQLSIKLWQPLFKNKRFKKGKAVVFIKESKFRTINVIIHSARPTVRTLTLSANEDINKICDDIMDIYRKKDYYIIDCGKRYISKFISKEGRLILSTIIE